MGWYSRHPLRTLLTCNLSFFHKILFCIANGFHIIQVDKELEEWKESVGSKEDRFWREYLTEAAGVESQLCEEREGFVQEIIQPLLRARGGLRGGGGRGEMGEEERERVKREGMKAVRKLGEEFDRLWQEVSAVRVEKEEEEDNLQ